MSELLKLRASRWTWLKTTILTLFIVANTWGTAICCSRIIGKPHPRLASTAATYRAWPPWHPWTPLAINWTFTLVAANCYRCWPVAGRTSVQFRAYHCSRLCNPSTSTSSVAARCNPTTPCTIIWTSVIGTCIRFSIWASACPSIRLFHQFGTGGIFCSRSTGFRTRAPLPRIPLAMNSTAINVADIIFNVHDVSCW